MAEFKTQIIDGEEVRIPRVITKQTYRSPAGREIKGPSLTQGGLAQGIKEMLDRFNRNIPLTGIDPSKGYYLGDQGTGRHPAQIHRTEEPLISQFISDAVTEAKRIEAEAKQKKEQDELDQKVLAEIERRQKQQEQQQQQQQE